MRQRSSAVRRGEDRRENPAVCQRSGSVMLPPSKKALRHMIRQAGATFCQCC